MTLSFLDVLLPVEKRVDMCDPVFSASSLCKLKAWFLHQVRLYDISAQRRPVIAIDFQGTAIKAVSEDLDGYTIYVGNGSGDLASFDMRTGFYYL